MDESTEAEWKGAEKNFLHELDDLYAYTPEVDVAMFPVDPRLGKEYMRGCRTVCNKDKNSYLCTHAFHTGVCQGKCFPRLCRSAWSAFCVIDTSRTKNRD